MIRSDDSSSREKRNRPGSDDNNEDIDEMFVLPGKPNLDNE